MKDQFFKPGLLRVRFVFIFFASVILSATIFAQVGISSSSITPDASSILELRSTTSGFLLPRMTTTQRDAIASPATGLVIYNSTTNQLNYYTGAFWQLLTGGTGVSSVSVTTANGVSGTVANATTTPAITLLLGAITPTSVAASGTITGSNLSGTNTGDQTTITGNAGSATLTAVTDDNATNATMYPTWVTTNSGNQAQKISSTKLSFNPSSGTLTSTAFSGNLTGNVTGNLNGNASTVTTNANLTGDVTSAGNATTIATNAVTNAKLAQMATNTIKGNNSGSTANAADLTVAQVNAILPVFTSTQNGTVPASGGGTDNYLRADGTFFFPNPGIAALTSATGSINTTETKILSTPIAANFMQAGTTFRVLVYGTCTSSAANTSNLRIRLGTAGNNTDAIVALVSTVAATTGSTIPFTTSFVVTIRTAGASGTAAGGGVLTNFANGTGISNTGVAVGNGTATINTTVANTLQVTYSSTATTTTSAFQIASIEVVNK